MKIKPPDIDRLRELASDPTISTYEAYGDWLAERLAYYEVAGRDPVADLPLPRSEDGVHPHAVRSLDKH